MRSTNGSANTPPEREPAALAEAAPRARGTRARRSQTRPRRRGPREAGPAGFGGGLSSARDRRRVLERNAAERIRVERMLADAPLPDFGIEPRPTITRAQAPLSPPRHATHGATSHCPVCSSTKLASDEVFAAGKVMRLVECLHCDHRFTARPRARWSDLGARMTRTSVALPA